MKTKIEVIYIPIKGKFKSHQQSIEQQHEISKQT